MFIYVSALSWILAIAVALLALRGFSGPSPIVQLLFISMCVASIIAAVAGILGLRSLRPIALGIESLNGAAALFAATMLKICGNEDAERLKECVWEAEPSTVY